MEIIKYDIPFRNGEPIKTEIKTMHHWEKVIKYKDFRKALRKIWLELGLKGILCTDKDEATMEKIVKEFGIISPFDETYEE